ncbi:MAG TPA: TIM barrel protein [Vicinamibacterales bacterium]|nr:TIM barrel protein [Vicinamibacterales bacterium]
MTRREWLETAGATLAWLSAAGLGEARARPAPPRAMLKNMGGEGPGFAHRRRAGKFDILEHCHALGLGAVRLTIPEGGPDAVRALRKKLDAYGMRCIVSAAPPRADAEVAAYEARIAAARELGAVTTHASFTQRRYEEFDTFEAFKASFEAHRKSVERAEPILRRHKVRLAIENHKGWRAAEHAAWVTQVGSEYVGVCYDFGNNIALCEDPEDTYRLLAPLTIYVSFKDMAVAPYEDGFLLSETALGEGILDIPGMVRGLQQRDPDMIFALEMITREPLKIPVFTKKYWATFDDHSSPLPGRDLARMLEIVRTASKPLTTTAGLSPEQALKLEDDLIDRSIAYARQHLSL